MGTIPNTVPAQDGKRRGIRAITERLGRGPVHVLQRDRPAFVALTEADFEELVEELDQARIAASLRDLDEGRARFGLPAEIMAALAE